MEAAPVVPVPVPLLTKAPKKPRAKKVVEPVVAEEAKQEVVSETTPVPAKIVKEKKPQTEKQKAAFERCLQARKEKQAEKMRLKAELAQAVTEAKAKVIADRTKAEEEKRIQDLKKNLPKNVKLAKIPKKGEQLGQDGEAVGFIKTLKRLIEEEVVGRVRQNALAYEADLAPEVPVVAAPPTKKRRVVEPQAVRSRSGVSFL